MLRRPIDGLIRVGELYRYLIHCEEGFQITNVGEAIDELLKACGTYGLNVTLRAAGELQEFRSQELCGPPPFDPSDSCEPVESIGIQVGNTRASKLISIVETLGSTLFAEARGIYSFFLSEKNIPIETLTEHPHTLLPEGVFNALPNIAKTDFLESSFCLAFGLGTAAAFHILRCTEAVLREYYCMIVKRKKDRLKRLLWSSMLDQLRQRKTKRPDDEILKGLDYIVLSHRNPTSHPEKAYDIDEAYEVFNLCIGAIPRIVKDKLWNK